MRTDKLYLVGFMGAGKTTLAKALGRRLDWRTEDLDELVEARERCTVADLFARRGEPYFRGVERDVLRSVLPLRPAVVATGGGTYADAANRALINDDGLSVWLDLPLQTVLTRVPADGRRPLAADRAQFETLYHQRRLAYQLAHLRLDALSPVEEMVERVLDWLGY
jgi:shikimate kinase